MATIPASQKVPILQRLFGRRVVGLNCVSWLDEKPVCLPAEFVAGSREVEISFGVEWPWLLPRFWPPPISIQVTDENDRAVTPTTAPMVAMRRRHTDLTFAMTFEAGTTQRQFRVEVFRNEDGQLLEHFELRTIDLGPVAQEVELLCFEMYALQRRQQILTCRYHDQVEQIQSCLQLRLANPVHASFLQQIGAEITLELTSHQTAAHQRWTLPAVFHRGALGSEMRLGSAARLFSGGPGDYRLSARIGAHPLGERGLVVVPFGALLLEAQARVLRETTLTTEAFSAVNHRGRAMPLQVVAEDFRSLEVSVTLECPLPDPLLPEVEFPLRIILTSDTQLVRAEQTFVALHAGRNILATSLSLEVALFASGPGAYTLELLLGDRALTKTSFQHQTRRQLKEAQAEAIFQSLTVQSPQLYTVRDGQRIQTDHVFATDEAVLPQLTICGQGFDEDVPGIKWRVTLRLVHVDNGRMTETQRFLTAKAGGNNHEIGRLRPNRKTNALTPGWYAYQFWKRDALLTEFRFRILAVEEIAPYTETILRASLKLENARLFAVASGSHYESSAIPDSTEFIAPEFTVRSSGYNRFLLRWPTELKLELQLPGGARRDLGIFQVVLANEDLTVNWLQVRVAGTTLGRQPGRHQLFVSVAGKQLAGIPFEVLTPAEVIARIKVSDLTVAAIAKSKQRVTNPQSLMAGETSSLEISCQLTVGLLAPGQSAEVTFELHLDDAIVAHKSSAVSLGHQAQPFKLRPVALADLLPHGVTGTKLLTIVVSVAGQPRHRQVITLVCHHRITNFEGQLNVDPHNLDVDDAEYDAILRRL